MYSKNKCSFLKKTNYLYDKSHAKFLSIWVEKIKEKVGGVERWTDEGLCLQSLGSLNMPE